MNRRSRENGHNVKLSKSLSHLLRHAAPKEKGINVRPGGYVAVGEILALPRFKHYAEKDFLEVVADNDKQRFSVTTDEEGVLLIRANQGHTFPIDEAELLEPIMNAEEYPVVIHGTYRRFWEAIQEMGLCRKARNHIHFAPGEPGTEGVISGMRSSVEIYIYINLKLALEDGLKFYRSANNVILTPGNEVGLLEPKYFSKVKDIKKGIILYPHS
jgi:2'-phosphotransferase